MRLVLHLFVNTLAVLTGAYVLRGVHVDSVTTALVVAVVLGLVNAFIRPLLILLTLPLTVLTLGLFIFVINALMILLVTKIVPGFTVQNFWWALLYSLIVTFIASFLNALSRSA